MNWLQKKQDEARACFNTLPTPNLRYGLTIKIKTEIVFPEKVITVDETQRPDSNENSTVMPLLEALMKYGELVTDYLFSTIDYTKDKFLAHHVSNLNRGTFVYIKKNTLLKEPLHITNNADGEGSVDHTLIIVEEGASVEVIQSTITNQKKGYHSEVIEVIAQDNSHVKIGYVQDLPVGFVNNAVLKARTGKNATVDWFTASLGSSLARIEASTFLDGEGSKTNNHGLFFGDVGQEFDLNMTSVHNAPHTESDILSKGSLNKQCSAIYRGLINIDARAPRSNAYQKEETLILGEDCEADAIPNLEINNNDVKCSHGTTIGRIDENKLFYLMTRGLSRKDAQKLVVEGFFNPLIEEIPIPELRHEVKKSIALKAEQIEG